MSRKDLIWVGWSPFREMLKEQYRAGGDQGRPDLLTSNYYGLVMAVEPNGQTMPVICGHGGSMWLCRSCANGLMAWEADHPTEAVWPANGGSET